MVEEEVEEESRADNDETESNEMEDHIDLRDICGTMKQVQNKDPGTRSVRRRVPATRALPVARKVSMTISIQFSLAGKTCCAFDCYTCGTRWHKPP
jgi:hypothetical protein